ncbi:MAG TPA: class I SAM-dependent methyltransferase [Acidimicrobiales bacterium]|nr:class I SAM-dependent methyltransferase [Acidimicrobiales bacterium]
MPEIFYDGDLTPEELVEEQKQYYKARAGEYDEWFVRRAGAVFGGTEMESREGIITRQSGAKVPTSSQATPLVTDRVMSEERQVVLEEFAGVDLGSDVLEFAGGTGIWTEKIASRAAKVTVVEASIEMVALNLAKLGEASSKVEFKVRDIFEWEPDHLFDSVVFCFWISHVPESMIRIFADLVCKSLKPGGKVFFVDDKLPSDQMQSPSSEVVLRRVSSGQKFRIVKKFWDSDRLTEIFSQAGIEISISTTNVYFQYGVGSRIG